MNMFWVCVIIILIILVYFIGLIIIINAFINDVSERIGETWKNALKKQIRK